jgi:hypothetical protein
MQTQYDIEQIADRLTSQLFDSSIHNRTYDHKERVAELAEEYMDDDDILWDTVIDESLFDSDAFTATLRAMTNAYALGRESDMSVFAKSIAQSVLEAVQKRAERNA